MLPNQPANDPKVLKQLFTHFFTTFLFTHFFKHRSNCCTCNIFSLNGIFSFVLRNRKEKKAKRERKSGNSTKRTGVPTKGKLCNVACILRNFSNESFPSSPSTLFYFSRIRRRRTILTNSNGISLMTYFFTEPTYLPTAYPSPPSIFCKHVVYESTDAVMHPFLVA